jgi:hypothetical protein
MPASPPARGQAVPAPTHSAPLPVPTQQPPPAQARFAQQAWPGPPHGSQVAPTPAPTHARLAPQVLPAQQGPLATPHASHWPPLQTRPAPVQIEPVQQGWFSTWPQPAQTPLLHVPPAPPPTAPQAMVLATQRGVWVDPAAQQPPALQVVLLQHGWPGSPQATAVSVGAVSGARTSGVTGTSPPPRSTGASSGAAVSSGAPLSGTDPPTPGTPAMPPWPPAPTIPPEPPLPPAPVPPTPVPPAPESDGPGGAGGSSPHPPVTRDSGRIIIAAANKLIRKPPPECIVFCTGTSLVEVRLNARGRRQSHRNFVNPFRVFLSPQQSPSSGQKHPRSGNFLRFRCIQRDLQGLGLTGIEP